MCIESIQNIIFNLQNLMPASQHPAKMGELAKIPEMVTNALAKVINLLIFFACR